MGVAPYKRIIHGDWIALERVLNDFYRILNVDATLSGMTSDTTAISSDLDIAESNIVWMESDIDTNKSDIVVLKSDVTTDKSDIVVLKSDVVTNASDILTVAGGAGSSSDVATNKSDIVVLKSDIAANDSDIVVLKSDIVSNDSDIVVLKSDVLSNDSDITVLKSDVASEISDTVVFKSDIASEKSDTVVFKSDIVVFKSDIASEKSDTVVFKSDIAANDSDIVVLKSDVSLNTTHRTSVGTDHGYIDQSVVQAASPTFAGLTITNACVIGSNSAVFQPNADDATFFEINDIDGNNILTVDTIANDLEVDHAIISGTAATGLDMSGGTFATAVQNWPTQFVLNANGASILHNFQHPTGGGAIPVGYNLFVGINAGNLSMGSTATATYHSSYNTGMGYASLYSNTTGYRNNAMGYGSLYSLKPTSKAITAFADYSETVAGTVLATSVEHGQVGTPTLQISGTTNYNGAEVCTIVDNDTFYFTAAWVSTETGWWAVDTEGKYNIGAGAYSGYALTTGSSDVFLGYYAGGRQTTVDNLLIIDNQDRTNVAGELANSLIYGTFAAAAADQSLRINATVSTSNQATTLGNGVTTFAVASNVMTVTGDGGGNTIASITGANSGTLLTLIFVDALVTITDTDAHTADTVDLAGTATNLTSADDTTLQIVYDGTSWYEISRSVN